MGRCCVRLRTRKGPGCLSAFPAPACVAVEAFLNGGPGPESTRTRPRKCCSLSWSARPSPTWLLDSRARAALPGVRGPRGPRWHLAANKSQCSWPRTPGTVRVASPCPPVAHLNPPPTVTRGLPEIGTAGPEVPPTAFLLHGPHLWGWPSLPNPTGKGPPQHGPEAWPGRPGSPRPPGSRTAAGGSQALLPLLNERTATDSFTERPAH